MKPCVAEEQPLSGSAAQCFWVLRYYAEENELGRGVEREEK